MRLALNAFLAMALLPLMTPATAAITVFTDEANFRAMVKQTLVRDDFETGNVVSNDPVLRRSAGLFGYAVSASPSFGGAGLFPAGGAGDRWLSSDNAQAEIVFAEFTPQIGALGGYFFTTNADGLAETGSITVVAIDDDGFIEQVIAESTVNSFIGFISSNSLSRVSVFGPRLTEPTFEPQAASAFASAQASELWPTVNNLLISPVPEPETWLMMVLGFGMIGAGLRAGKRSNASMRSA